MARQNYYIWLAAAVISAALLMNFSSRLASGDTTSLGLFIVFFVVFSITAVGATYWHSQRNSSPRKESDLLEQVKSEIDQGKEKQ